MSWVQARAATAMIIHIHNDTLNSAAQPTEHNCLDADFVCVCLWGGGGGGNGGTILPPMLLSLTYLPCLCPPPPQPSMGRMLYSHLANSTSTARSPTASRGEKPGLERTWLPCDTHCMQAISHTCRCCQLPDVKQIPVNAMLCCAQSVKDLNAAMQIN